MHATPPVEGWRVLIADQQESDRELTRQYLEPLGCWCAEVADGGAALELARNEPPDLILLNRSLPGLDGYEVIRQLRERPPRPHIKLLLMSGRTGKNELTEALGKGADDLVVKPLDPQQLAAKVQYTLRLKDAQDRADHLAQNLLMVNRQLEHSLQARANDVHQAQDALLFAMAKMAESREGETPGHMRRMQLYCRTLAERLAGHPLWKGIVTEVFLDQLERCVPLHDIGKIGLPDTLLNKPGLLTEAERRVMETHTLIGAGILDALARGYGESLAFLAVAAVIVRYHHERFDGHGYPDGLAGEAIPPAARLVVLADVYDALRRKRCHKPAMTHPDAVRTLLKESPGQFDPAVLEAFAGCQDEFNRIFHQVRN
jgi:putative two-component system response regulator